MNTRASLAFTLPAALLLLGGCIIVGNNTGSGGAGGSGNSTVDSSSSSSSTSSSSGNAGGAGGAGGAGVGGAGVGGGGGTCVTDKDGILDALSCEKLNTQQTGMVCGPNKDQAPLANGTCTHGFDIYQRGAFDVLVNCLQTIPGDATNACNDTLVSDCVQKMYQAACPSQNASSLCQTIAGTGCNAGDVFNTQECEIQTNPLNDTSLNKIIDCMNMSTEPDCNKAYSACFDQLLTF